MAKKPTAAAAPVEEEEGGVDFSDGGEGGVMVDLNDVEDSSFEAIPRSMYDCVVDDLSFEYSQNSGNPMWTVRLEVEDGDYAGRKLFFHLVFKGNGLPRTKRTIARLWPHLLEGPFNPEEVADEGSLVGTRCRARVDIRKYQGEDRNNVRDVFAAEDGGENFLQ